MVIVSGIASCSTEDSHVMRHRWLRVHHGLRTVALRRPTCCSVRTCSTSGDTCEGCSRGGVDRAPPGCGESSKTAGLASGPAASLAHVHSEWGPPRKSGKGGMDELLGMISQRRKPRKRARAKEVFKPVDGLLAKHFVQAPKSKLRPESRCAVPSNTVTRGKDVVSPSLLNKLRENVIGKQIDWKSIEENYPTLPRLPVWKSRSEWTEMFLPSSALPPPGAQRSPHVSSECSAEKATLEGSMKTTTEVFVCNAPTGSGKSSLLPLFLLDSHWRRVEHRLNASWEWRDSQPLIANHGSIHETNSSQFGCALAVPSFPTNVSTREFATIFSESSRLCIVVSQPTRFACVQLAKFTAALLAPFSSSAAAATVGGRVGYAVGGDMCFSAASEIVYATPGYILNSLQHSSGALCPTALIIDEVHCRDMETDLLLAWTKHRIRGASQQQRRNACGQRWGLRQLILMSATLPADQMVAYLTAELPGLKEAGVGRGMPLCQPHILEVGSNAQLTGQVVGSRWSGGLKSGTPYHYEEYFIDDLPAALRSSKLLCAGGGAVCEPDRGGSSSDCTQCPLLSPHALRVTAALVHFFSYTRFGPDIHSPQARVLAQFLLFTLQSIAVSTERRSWLGTPSGDDTGREKADDLTTQHRHPESILVFLPGFAEMSLVLQCMDLLCVKPCLEQGQQGKCQQRGDHACSTVNVADATWSSHAMEDKSSTNVTLLEYEGCSFSVALLHATAVGNPQQQLRDSVGLCPYRIILSTNVAESSVTIPNVRCVVDTCLERRFLADPLTGVMLRSTAVISASSARQRAGRAGRTCDSVVIRLAPRHLFSPRNDYTDPFHANGRQHETSVAVEEGSSGRETASRGGNEKHRLYCLATNPRGSGPAIPPPPPSTISESSAVSVTALLLRLKYLFPLKTSSLLTLLPDAPQPQAVAHGIQQLIDLDLIEDIDRTPPRYDSNGAAGSSKEIIRDENFPTLMCFYDSTRLSAKGEFVAYFPIPHEQALLMYYSLRFLCIEGGVLVACAMTVPSLFSHPRFSVHTGEPNSSEAAPAAQFLQSLLAQRNVASKVGGKPEHNGVHSLSEPLVLLSVLHDWYACTSSNDVVAFTQKYRVNRRALRIVDNTIAQCAIRLWRLLIKGSGACKKNFVNSDPRSGEMEMDSFTLCGEHDRAERYPSTPLVEQLLCSVLSESRRALLATSLLRLHRCALERASQRFSTQQRTMTQWYPYDEQLIEKLWPQPPVGGECKEGSEQEPIGFGTLQERLYAAFVAAYARNTMRGEDVSHRTHQRRMTRNMGVLEGGDENVCSFSVEMHVEQQQQQQQWSLYERLTPEVLRTVLAPYLAGTHVKQIELFSTRRSGIVTFASDKAEVGSQKDGKDTKYASVREDGSLLSPVPLQSDPAALAEKSNKTDSPAIKLPHIGISLLVSLQSALTRLTALLPHTPSSLDSLQSMVNNPGTVLDACSNAGKSEVDHTVPIVSLNQVGSGRRILLSDEKTNPGPPDVRVAWYDTYGREHSLLLSDVRQLGYEELFPKPTEVAKGTVENRNTVTNFGELVVRAPDKTAATPVLEPDLDGSEEGAEQHVLLSVKRVVFTRAVQWKVTLPIMRPFQERQPPLDCSEGETKTPESRVCYCWVCHSAWFCETLFDAHCRSVAHLNRLLFAVQSGMRRGWIESFSRGTLSDILLRQRDKRGRCADSVGGVGVQLRSCSVSPLSFLNALQWRPHSTTGSRMLPIAIAGSLVGNLTSHRTKSSSDNGLMLQALHVWIMDTETGGSGLPLSLFALAGYLAASSAGFDAALLMNVSHSRAYAIMLHDWGVWRFPVPLDAHQLRSVMMVYSGSPWRGVPVGSRDTRMGGGSNATGGNSCGGTAPLESGSGKRDNGEESLHWCVVSEVCPQCTYCGSDSDRRKAEGGKPKGGGSYPPSTEQAVHSALLIVLNEYRNSLRNVVSFADYIQRVVSKLNLWSVAEQMRHKAGNNKQLTKHPELSRPPAGMEHCCGAELLSRMVASRHGQPIESLLRDIGCQFLSPSAALFSAEKREASTPMQAGNTTSDGAVNEKLFIVPAILPGYLPSPDFSTILRQHRLSVRNSQASVLGDRISRSRSGETGTTVKSATPGIPPQE
ncbi:unnamed protein product, partial [Trypanosoma congolense IL3000]